MTITRMTYQYAGQSLSLFFQKNDKIDENAISDTVKFDDSPAGRLFTALRDRSGDFSNGGTAKLPREPITNSIWYKNSTKPEATDERPPLFAFHDFMGCLATLCFAIPKVGIVASAGVTAFTALQEFSEENAHRQAEWFKRVSEVKNPPDSPYQEVVDQIINHLDNSEINEVIKNVFADITSIQTALNKILVDPDRVTTAAEGKFHAATHLTKRYVLGENELGKVFSLEASTDFRKLLNADDSWINQTLDLSLDINPTYAESTLSAFLSASITMVNAFLVYAFIYVLPDEALTDPNWDSSGFDIKLALATKGKKEIEGLEHTAWDAMSILYDRLDPASGEFMKRLQDAHVVWNKIYDRLKKVTFDCNQKAYRNGLYYLEKSKSIPADVRGNLKDYLFNSCEDPQIVCWDQATDDFINNRFRGFHTTLNLNFHPGTSIADIASYFLTFGGELFSQTATSIGHNEDKTYTEFTYPLNKDMKSNEHSYKDIFWAPGFSFNPLYKDQIKIALRQHGAFKDATKPGLLETSAGRDIVAWLGMVLANYCQQFRFHIDFENKTNTLTMALATLKAYEAAHKVVASLLGERV